ncbi:MAG: hypothetical protein HXY38_06720 [Chloroflexi bacterium]|nr:hypothetical protein [Chloroflexota bacterium]
MPIIPFVAVCTRICRSHSAEGVGLVPFLGGGEGYKVEQAFSLPNLLRGETSGCKPDLLKLKEYWK